MSKVVIIGGVAGGASCAARLRRIDESAEILLLERGDYISYANCGLPYYVGNVIRSKSALLLQSPKGMKEKFNIDVRVKNEVLAIDRPSKTITVKRLETGEIYKESYDSLVISTGSSPLRPRIAGIDSPRIETLWTVPDTLRITEAIKERGVKSAAVIGGGFIGLEMAENLSRLGLKVSIVEMLDQVMAPLDYEMAQLLHENISSHGVELHLGDGVDSFSDNESGVTVTLKSGLSLTAELVILSIGVRPNSELARDAGLEIGARGGIATDDRLLTSDPSIYAVGDVIEVADLIFGDRTLIPLAGPANKQGRIAADNIAGGDSRYSGTQGSSVAQIFDLTAAATGANEKSLIKRGLKRGADYESIIISQNSHAGYYPDAEPMTIKLLFASNGGKIFGAQIVGRGGVDKRIDVLSTAIRLGAPVAALKELELAYAPPYSSAKDPVNMAGFTADNLLRGLVRFAPWDVIESSAPTLLDVREDSELAAFSLPNSVHIPLGQLRSRLSELDRAAEIVIMCAIGVRAYNAYRILAQNGFKNVSVYAGGSRFYRSTHYLSFNRQPVSSAAVLDSGHIDGAVSAGIAMRLDCCGMQCPGPVMRILEAIRGMSDGEVMEVSASDPDFSRDIAEWCRRTGNTLLQSKRSGSDYVVYVKKGV